MARKLTKTDMARVIAQNFYSLPEPPEADHWHVVALLRYAESTLRKSYRASRRALRRKGLLEPRPKSVI